MALIDLLKWNSIPGVYVWKYPSDELSTATQLIVAESQEAVLFKGGKLIQSFGPGQHTLSTMNIPILGELFKIPFGGQSPFKAEVWYINKAISLDVKWGTIDPIQLMDPKYQIMLPVRAFGQFGIQVIDGAKFLVKLVGTLTQFDANTLMGHFKGIVMTQVKDSIAKKLVKESISILEINASISEISNYLQSQCENDLEEFGLRMVHFKVMSINAPEDDPSVKKLKDALAKRAEMNIVGYSYQQERSFDTLETAAANTGGSMAAPMTATMGMGMGLGIGTNLGNVAAGMSQQLQPQLKPCIKCGNGVPQNTKFCPHCGANNEAEQKLSGISCHKCNSSVALGSKFCPKCGNMVNPCPKCNNDNPENASICRSCNSQLPKKCSSCSTLIPEASKFCPSCGKSMVLACAKCGQELAQGTKFCGQCGTPQ